MPVSLSPSYSASTTPDFLSPPIRTKLPKIQHIVQKSLSQTLPKEAHWAPLDDPSFVAGRVHPSGSAMDLSIFTRDSVANGGHTAVFEAPTVTVTKEGNIRERVDFVRLCMTDSEINSEKISNTLQIQRLAYAQKGKRGYVAYPPEPVSKRQYLQPNEGIDLWLAHHNDEVPSAGRHGKPYRLNTRSRTECLLQAALGIEQTHAAGIIHADIKLENFLVKQDFRGKLHVKLIDFGDSQYHDQAINHFPIWREFWTTPAQNGMSPSFADDIFGLGCLIADMIMPGLDLHYDRSYLTKSPKELEKIIDNAVKNEETRPLAELVKRIFLADQSWTKKALKEHVHHVTFSAKASKNAEFNLDDYHAIQSAVWNCWREQFEPEDRDSISEAPIGKKCQKSLKNLKPMTLSGCEQWQKNLDLYREQAEAAFPTIQEIIEELQRIRDSL